jgi:hypothetical protein
MRTALFIAVGLTVWAAGVGITRHVVGASSSSMMTVTVLFLAVWFLVAAINMWVGVTRAGYSFAEELPIFFLIFLVPAVIAGVAKWKFL